MGKKNTHRQQAVSAWRRHRVVHAGWGHRGSGGLPMGLARPPVALLSACCPLVVRLLSAFKADNNRNKRTTGQEGGIGKGRGMHVVGNPTEVKRMGVFSTDLRPSIPSFASVDSDLPPAPRGASSTCGRSLSAIRHTAVSVTYTDSQPCRRAPVERWRHTVLPLCEKYLGWKEKNCVSLHRE